MTTTKKWMWVARNKHGTATKSGRGSFGHYYVARTKRELVEHKNTYGACVDWDGESARMCAKDFEAVTGIRLEPGEGPVKVFLEVWRA